MIIYIVHQTCLGVTPLPLPCKAHPVLYSVNPCDDVGQIFYLTGDVKNESVTIAYRARVCVKGRVVMTCVIGANVLCVEAQCWCSCVLVQLCVGAVVLFMKHPLSVGYSFGLGTGRSIG